jgi:predicted  nucleic acid-binding Zn-ribbon protein
VAVSEQAQLAQIMEIVIAIRDELRDFRRASDVEHEQNRLEHEQNRREHEQNRREHEAIQASVRHLGVEFEDLRADVRLLAEGVSSLNEKLDRKVVDLEEADAALDRRVTRLAVRARNGRLPNGGGPPGSRSRS